MSKYKIEMIIEVMDQRAIPAQKGDAWREGELNPSNFGHQPWQGRSRALRTSDTVRGSLGDTSYQDRMYMVKHDLTALDRNTTRLLEMTANNKNMPEWAKSKLTEARSHVSAVANYRQSKLGLTKETGKKVNFIIPSGNMGNSIACFWAREMGCPIGQIYLSTNANKAVPNYYETLSYGPRASVKTLANAMDVGAPNNMERLLSLYKGKEKSLNESSKAVSVSDEDIKKTILNRLKEGESGWGVLLCPHTATAAFVRGLFPDDEFIIVGTAHPSKFDDVLSPLLGGKSLPLPSGPKTLVMRTPKFKTLPSNFDEVKQALLQEL